MAVIWQPSETGGIIVRHAVAGFLWVTLALFLIMGLLSCDKSRNEALSAAPMQASQTGANETAKAFARKVVSLIAERRIAELSELVHPQKGVLFSPCGYIDQVNAISLSGKQLVDAWQQNEAFIWGLEDGSGDPISLTIKNFFTEYVYSVDYLNADQVSVNKLIGYGNSLVNIDTVFPEAVFVEFHFAGLFPEYQGLDWRSLRVVMEKDASDGWWLVAILNDQWTI